MSARNLTLGPQWSMFASDDYERKSLKDILVVTPPRYIKSCIPTRILYIWNYLRHDRHHT